MDEPNFICLRAHICLGEHSGSIVSYMFLLEIFRFEWPFNQYLLLSSTNKPWVLSVCVHCWVCECTCILQHLCGGRGTISDVNLRLALCLGQAGMFAALCTRVAGVRESCRLCCLLTPALRRSTETVDVLYHAWVLWRSKDLNLGHHVYVASSFSHWAMSLVPKGL